MDYLQELIDLRRLDNDPELFAIALALRHVRVLIQHGGSDRRRPDDDSALHPHHLEAFLARAMETPWKDRRIAQKWRRLQLFLPRRKEAWERGKTLFQEDLDRAKNDHENLEYCSMIDRRRWLCLPVCLPRLSRQPRAPEPGHQWLYADVARTLPQGSRWRGFHRSGLVIGVGMVMAQHFEEIALARLPMWEISIPDIPPRSKLYSLAPLGLNSPLVESLTSYLCRLAYEHHVEVGTLVQQSIAPMLGKRYIADSHGRGVSSFLRYANSINGNGLMASDWVDALEALTLRADLAQLTLLVGTDALSQRDLLQPIRQWCPRCYDAWQRQGAIIYEPLLWSINGISVCPEHSQHLERRCPHCSASLPWFTWCSRPGYCSSCGKWLGRADGRSQVEEKERYLAETVGDFLAHMPQLPLAIPREGVIQSLRDLIATTTDGNMAAFARSLGRPKTSLWELVQGYFPTSLPFVLQLCYQFRLPLLLFLLGREQAAPGEAPVSQEQPPKRDARCPFDRENVQQALEAILADQQSVPLSMREVARRLGYPVRTIETHFPLPCRDISHRYAAYRKQQGQRRKARLRQRITEAARVARMQGENLTFRRVGTIIGEPGCFREYEARLVLRDIRCRKDAESSLE